MICLAVCCALIAAVTGCVAASGATHAPSVNRPAPTGQRASAAHSASPFFAADPNVTGNLSPWQYFDSGGTFSVKRFPNGTTHPGIVRIAEDPLHQQGKVYQETVTPTSRWWQGASRGDWTYLYNAHSAAYFGRNGETDWFHFRVMFPGNGAYRNTHGSWNVLFESHMNSGYIDWPDACEDAELDLTVVQYTGDRHPYLALRILGGSDTCPLSYGKWILDRRHRLRHNHWYDVLFHVVWSPDPSIGFVSWWLDGRRMFSHHIADLWRRPDGSTDQVEFELNNYRLHETYDSTVYYSQTRIGPTRGSVRFR